MELIEGFIIIFAVGVCCVVVHRVYRYTMRGKTYEEAIAEQRKMPLEHLLLGRGKDKNKDKKTKKVGKKAKEKPLEKEKTELQSKVAPSVSVKGDGVQKTSAQTGSKVESVTKVASSAASAKTSASPSSAVHSEKHRAVEFGKPEAEVVNDPATSQDEGKSKKKKKAAEKGVKPILLNRDEVSPVDISLIKDEPETPRTVNHFEESKPKDEFLKRKHSKEETGNPAQKPKEKAKASDKAHPEALDAKAKVSAAEKEQKQEEKSQTDHAPAPQAAAGALAAPLVVQPEKEVQEVVREEVEVQAVQVTHAAAPASSQPESKRKKKKSDLLTLQQMDEYFYGNAGPGGVNVSLLEPLIRKADLSRSEVQNLIDLLLNKQQESATEDSEWTEGRQDPVVKLKKQLAEKEKALAEEQEATQQWQVRVRELRAELNGERTRLGTSYRKLEGSMEQLTAKLQTESDSHAEEKRALMAQVQELRSKLTEEHMQHCKIQEREQKAMAAIQQELHGQHAQLEVHMSQLRQQHEVETEKMLADIARLKEEVKSREESRLMHTSELMKVKEELSALQTSRTGSDEECKRLRDVVSKAEAAAKMAVTEANSAREMARRMEEDARKSCIECEQQVVELKAVTSALKMRETELEAEVSRVIGEAEAEKGRLQGSLSEAEERVRRAEEAKSESEEQVRRVEKEKLDAEERVRKAEEELAQRAEAERSAERQAETELQATHQRQIQERDAFIQQLSDELSYYKTEIPKLSEALEVQRKKNDELRQKNWKAMEALTATENILKAHLKNLQNIAIEDGQKAILEEQDAVKQLLQRIFPSVTVDGAVSHSDWVKAFEASACEYLKETSQADKPVDCDAHLKEIEHLHARIAHYLNIVKETEAMLSNLQNTVENQETRWSEQLERKEEELRQVTGERDDLVATLEEYQSPPTPAASTEIEEKVQNLECRLKLENEEKQNLSAHCDSLQKTQSEREVEHATALKTMEDLQNELSSLKIELTRRQVQNDDLSKEVVKLNSLVKIGQASLSQEQLQVKEMKEELEILKAQSQNHTATNGPASESTISEQPPPTPENLPMQPHLEEQGVYVEVVWTSSTQEARHIETALVVKWTTKPVSVKRRRLSGWFSKKLTSRKKLKKSPAESSDS